MTNTVPLRSAAPRKEVAAVDPDRSCLLGELGVHPPAERGKGLTERHRGDPLTDPVRFLVVPRVLASAISLVLLAVIADLAAVGAGGLIGVFQLGIPYEVYKNNTIDQLSSMDFLTGLFKAGVFGTILGLIACRNGLMVSGGAAGVGKATTDTVVQTVVTVIFADLFFTAVFYALGWS